MPLFHMEKREKLVSPKARWGLRLQRYRQKVFVNTD